MDSSLTTNHVAFPTRRLGHVNLFVANLARSHSFYSEICGFEDVGTEQGTDVAFVSNGNTHHDFGLVGTGKSWRGRSGETIKAESSETRAGLNHLGWELDTDEGLIQALKRAKAAKLDDRYFMVEHTVAHSVYLPDPDGNIHEFYADVEENWRTVFSGGAIPRMSALWTPDERNVVKTPKWNAEPELRRVESAPVHPLRTARVVMIASNLQKLLDFYTNIAGLELAFIAPDKSYAFLRGRSATRDYHCALIQQRAGLVAGCHHASCELPDEDAVKDAEAQIKDRRIPLVKSVDNELKRSFFIKDPDGFLVEFFVSRAPAYQAVSRYDSEERVYLV